MAIGHFTHAGSNLYLNHILRGQQKPQGQTYLAPFITTPTKQGPGAEPAGATRILMTEEDWNAASAGETVTIRNLVFPRSDGWKGNVIALGVFTSSTGGTCLAYFIPDDGELIETNDALIVLAGGLRHRFTAGFFSLNLQNAILNDLYRAVPLPVPPSLWLAHYSTAPAPAVSPTVGGTETTDPAYDRQPVAINGTSFGAPTGGTATSSLEFAYAAATVSQGSRTHWGLHDAADSGNFVLGGTIVTPKTVDVGDPLKFGIGALSISLDA